MVKTKKFILQKHFDGPPKPTDFQIVEEELPPMKDGEFLAETVFLSVDPYQRLFAAELPLGSEFLGTQIAKIVISRNNKFPIGKYVIGHFGWCTHTISDGKKPDDFFPAPWIVPEFEGLPLSYALSILGMPGASAYFGFLEICQPIPGETVVVTAAGGAVGSIVGQIAKIKGCKVVGIAGSDEKGKWLIDELKFDHFINYKDTNFVEQLTAATSDGVDCYFDNVGGEISYQIVQRMNDFGRISVCGGISTYNHLSEDKGSIPQAIIIRKQLKIEGFLVLRWFDRLPEAIRQLKDWLNEGKLKYRETITEGFENTTDAFIGMLSGRNIGKAIVKI